LNRRQIAEAWALLPAREIRQAHTTTDRLNARAAVRDDVPTIPDAICSSFSGNDSGQLVGIQVDGGELDSSGAIDVPSPMFLAIAPDGEHCYVVHDHDGGEISTVAIGEGDGENSDLEVLNRQATGGDEPCYVSVDAAGEFAFTANYGGGSVSLFPIDDDGRLGERAQVIEHEGSGPHPERQNAPCPHSIVPGPNGRFVYAADLGTDEIWCYELDREAGRLEPAEQPTVEIHDGAGPRHIAFHPDSEIAYLLNELDSTLTVLAIDGETGALDPLETVDTLPDTVPDAERAESYPADLAVHPSGEWLYCSNRGHDSIAVFEIGGSESAGGPGSGRDGDSVERITNESTRGEWPRDIELAPDSRHLFVENRRSDEIVTFAVDEADGTISATGETCSITEPVCLVFRNGD
jgi:6-phosphogluconolactonase